MITEGHETSNPEVVIVGMPSCGKTVFLTVLGKKFTNQAEGRESAPLGFRMWTGDKDTLTVVNDAFQRLSTGQWPLVTEEGRIMPLKWDVFTGQRKIFELLSMDIAGETFRKAFDIQDSGERGASVSKSARSSKKSGANSDGEIFHGASVSDSSASGDKDDAVRKLKAAVSAAKVFCFMVNIDLPDPTKGESLTNEERVAFERFKNAAGNMFLALKDNAELRAKSIIILTQAFRHQGAIDRAGGPALFLGQVCGQYGSELSGLALENDIPVLAVSAINETGNGEKGLPTIRTASDIPSFGLFGFLLVVAGNRVPKDDSLAHVKDAYLVYRREWAEYLKFPSLLVDKRFEQAKVCWSAAQAFTNACKSYLAETSNLTEWGSVSSLKPATLDTYRRFTFNDPEVKTAKDNVYFRRDELWDRVLRRAVVLPGQINVYEDVLKGLATTFPDKKGNEANEEFIYGFGEEDFVYGSDANSYPEWIDLNLKAYDELFKDTIDEIDGLGEKLSEAIGILESSIRGPRFRMFAQTARTVYDRLETKLASFRSEWLDDGRIPFPKFEPIKEILKESLQKILAAEKLRERYELRCFCLKAGACCLAVMLLAGSVLYAVHRTCDKKNRRIVNEIGQAVSHFDYERARTLSDAVVSLDWLGVHRDVYLGARFTERLDRTEAEHKIRQSCKELEPSLKALYVELDENDLPSFASRIKKAREQYDKAIAGYKALPDPISFTEPIREGHSPDPRIRALQDCAGLLEESIQTIKKIKDDKEKYLEDVRKKAFDQELDDAHAQLAKMGSNSDGLTEASITDYGNEIARRHEKLKELAGVCEEDGARAAEFERMAEAKLTELRSRFREQRKHNIMGILAGVREARTSNSLELAWARFSLVPFAIDDNERQEQSNLKAELQDSTAQVFERELADIEQETEKVRKGTVSVESWFGMLEGTEDAVISEHAIAETRQAQKRIQAIREGQRKWLADNQDVFDRVESRVNEVNAKLAVIVQIEGLRPGQTQAFDIDCLEHPSDMMTGTSPETNKQCVYLIVPRKDVPSTGSRLVRVSQVDDNKAVPLAISLARLAPGINRCNLEGELLKRKEGRE